MPCRTTRPPQQQGDGGGVDEKCAELRYPVLACGVADAYQQRRDERAAQRSQSADRHHDQKIDKVLKRIGRLNRGDIGAQPPAQRGKAAAQRERDGKQARGVDADCLGHWPVVHRGSHLGAPTRPLDPKPQRRHQYRAECYEEHPVRGKVPAEQRKLSLEVGGQVYRLLQRAVNQTRHRNRHED